MSDVVVCGGGVVGLLVSLMLARRGFDVLMVERDTQPVPRAHGSVRGLERPGVAQGIHAHLFTARITQVLRDELPDVLEAMSDWGITTVEECPGQEVRLQARRPVFEAVLRAAAQRQPGLTMRTGSVTGLTLTGRRVDGVLLDGAGLRTRLVIDATGKRSRSPRWLQEHGIEVPAEQYHPCDLHYFSRHYRLRPDADGSGIDFMGELTPYAIFLGIRQDDRTYAFTGAVSKTDPVRGRLLDPNSFEAVLSHLPALGPWLGLGEPLGDVTVMGGIANRRRSLIKNGRPVVDGLLLLGDAHLYTNATFGQGIGLGAWQTHALTRLVDELGLDADGLGCGLEEWSDRVLGPRFDAQVAVDTAMVTSLRAGIRGEIPPNPMMQQPFAALTPLSMAGDQVAAAAQYRYGSLLCTADELMADPEVVRRLVDAEAASSPAPDPGPLSRAEFEALVAAPAA